MVKTSGPGALTGFKFLLCLIDGVTWASDTTLALVSVFKVGLIIPPFCGGFED